MESGAHRETGLPMVSPCPLSGPASEPGRWIWAFERPHAGFTAHAVGLTADLKSSARWGVSPRGADVSQTPLLGLLCPLPQGDAPQAATCLVVGTDGQRTGCHRGCSATAAHLPRLLGSA